MPDIRGPEGTRDVCDVSVSAECVCVLRGSKFVWRFGLGRGEGGANAMPFEFRFLPLKFKNLFRKEMFLLCV